MPFCDAYISEGALSPSAERELLGRCAQRPGNWRSGSGGVGGQRDLSFQLGIDHRDRADLTSQRRRPQPGVRHDARPVSGGNLSQ